MLTGLNSGGGGGQCVMHQLEVPPPFPWRNQPMLDLVRKSMALETSMVLIGVSVYGVSVGTPHPLPPRTSPCADGGQADERLL